MEKDAPPVAPVQHIVTCLLALYSRWIGISAKQAGDWYNDSSSIDEFADELHDIIENEATRTADASFVLRWIIDVSNSESDIPIPENIQRLAKRAMSVEPLKPWK